MNVRDINYMRGFDGEEDYMEDLKVDGKIILNIF